MQEMEEQARQRQRKRPAILRHWRYVSRRWLYLGEDLILISVAVIMIVAGLFIVVDAVGSLASAVASHSIAQVIFGVAESALLALILAELVHSLVMSLEGHGLSPEPFLIIAIVAILRKMLLTTVQITTSPDQQTTALVVGELLGLALVILTLAIALTLILRHRKPSSTNSA